MEVLHNNKSRTRFAPSPTGRMHIGSVRSMFLTYMYAVKNNADFILRIDDTDKDRSTEENIQHIYNDVEWFGIKYNSTFKQSDRSFLYKNLLDKCLELGLVYPVYDTQDEILFIQKMLETQNKAPAYKRCHAKYIENRSVYWRFDIGNEKITFHDQLKGEISIDLGSISDPVICKPDHSFTYIFASVIDDLEEKIDFIIRGNDHLSNTGTQLCMFNKIMEFGIYPKREISFAHYPLFAEYGAKMSKRNNALSMAKLKENFHQLTLAHYVSYLGNKSEHLLHDNINQIAQNFDFNNYSNSNILEFKESDLLAWQKRVFANTDYNLIKQWINNDRIDLQNSWHIIKDCINSKKDIIHWHNVINNRDIAFTSTFNPNIADINHDNLVDSVAHQFKHKRDAMLFLRHILTGLNSGPKINDTLQIIPEDIMIKRLKQYQNINFTLFNHGSEEVFHAIGSKVKIYACGPTVYMMPHIGNFRSFIICDVLCRFVKKFYPILFVRNITDIDDKIVNICMQTKKNLKDFTNHICDEFHVEAKRLNLLEPNFEPKVTNYISKILEYIDKMVASGHAYVAQDGVYFKVDSIDNYDIFKCCDLQKSNDLILNPFNHNHEAILDSANAPNSRDFALWKLKDDIFWESKYGNGRPGWHIECTTISKELLDLPLDIHFGGKDLIFPHHTNECAQGMALGRTTANYWVHNNFININNDKMSKSAGNHIYTKNCNLHPMIIRMALLLSHYRHELAWNDEVIVEASALYNKWRRIIGENLDLIDPLLLYEPSSEFLSALSSDLNTPKAFRVLDQELNNLAIGNIISGFDLLGIVFEFHYLTNAAIMQLIDKRNMLRKERNFDAADKIKEELYAMNVELKDAQNKTIWYQRV